MLGEEDVKKQIKNNEVEVKEKAPEVESTEPRGDAFTLEETQLKNIIKEVGDSAIDPSRYLKEITSIVDYVKQSTGAKDFNDILWEVRLLSNKVGRDAMGESQIKRMYRYAYLNNEKASIERELKKYEYDRSQ